MGSSCEIFNIKVRKRFARYLECVKGKPVKVIFFFFGVSGLEGLNPLSHTFEVDSIVGFSVPALAGLFITVFNSLFLHFCPSADPLLIL